MGNTFAQRITKKLIDYQCIDIENRNIYEYGFRALLFMIPSLFIMIVISIVFNQFIFSILFLLFYAIIRAFYPGGHFNSQGKCFVWSLIAFMLILVIEKDLMIYIKPELQIYILVICSMIMQMTKILTVNSYNKKVKKEVLIITIFESIYLIANMQHIYLLSNSIFLALLSSFLLYTIELIRKRYLKA